MDTTSSENRAKLILGVDDNASNLAFLKMNLVTAGYTFVGVASGHECLDLILRVSPKLILLDIQMPLMDGFETCQRLRALPEAAHVPIAFLTSRKTREDVQKGLAAGGNDFIVKPFNRDHLLERVRHWTARHVGSSNART